LSNSWNVQPGISVQGVYEQLKIPEPKISKKNSKDMNKEDLIAYITQQLLILPGRSGKLVFTVL
jgi:hypothetical protein